jgi:chemosensory pili system protein ChpA (sensor histidine kinase/response regulator)
VVKTLGPQITGIPGVSGATILGDGSIVVILDVGTLVRAQREAPATAPVLPPSTSGCWRWWWTTRSPCVG